MTLDESGRLGIGTTSPATPLHIEKAIVTNDSHTGAVILARTSNLGSSLFHQYSTTVTGEAFGLSVHGGTTLTDTAYTKYLVSQGGTHIWYGPTTSNERARIDSSGRLLVGTSTSESLFASALQVAGAGSAGTQLISGFAANATPSVLYLAHSRSGAVGTNTILQNNDGIGYVDFYGANGTSYDLGARIAAEVDGTPGANDMPGRLVFSTTADGAASPTERLRITSAGVIQVADAGNITVGTTTGTKIGTATTQKIGFYNATPVVQPAAVADATDAASVIARLNDLLARLRTLGIIAT